MCSTEEEAQQARFPVLFLLFAPILLLLPIMENPQAPWAVGRIYRVGTQMQGKRPTLPELWRWVRVGLGGSCVALGVGEGDRVLERADP